VFLARQLDEPARLTGAQVDALHNRYVLEYGQRPREEILPAAADASLAVGGEH
jgi:hypothetical protein